MLKGRRLGHIKIVIGTNAEQNGNSTAIILNLLVKTLSKSVEIQISTFHRNKKHNGRLSIKIFWVYFKLATEDSTALVYQSGCQGSTSDDQDNAFLNEQGPPR